MKKVNFISRQFFVIFCITQLLSVIIPTNQVFANNDQNNHTNNFAITSLSERLFDNLGITAKISFPKKRSDQFIENDIVFYNPNGRNANNCNEITAAYDGKISTSGANATEKVWSSLRSLGYTKEQTAGIIGSLLNSSNNLNPAGHNNTDKDNFWKDTSKQQIDNHFDLSKNEEVSYGIGIIPFTYQWRVKFINYLIKKDEDLLKYLNTPNEYSPSKEYSGNDFIKDAGEDIFDKLLAMQLEFIHDPSNSDYINRIKSIKQSITIENMVTAWTLKINQCLDCTIGDAYALRLKSAQNIFKTYSSESFMNNGKSVTTTTSHFTVDNPTAGNHGTLLSKHSTITFYGPSAAENAGYAGKNAHKRFNNNMLSDGQVAISTKDPDLKLGDVIYIESTPDMTKEGSFAHGKYFIVTDTGAGERAGGYNIDVFHHVNKSSENNNPPYGYFKSAKIYKVATDVSWDDYVNKYKNKSGGGSDGSDITIIGDNITKKSNTQLLKLLPKADIIAQDSKHFIRTDENNPSGLDIIKKQLESNNLRKIVVFALGTNDLNTLSSEKIKEVIKLAGDRQIILVTNFSKDSIENTDFQNNNNNLFKTISNNNKKVTIADWSQAISAKINLLIDNYNPNSEGAELFANVIQQAINNLFNKGGSTANINCPTSTASNITVVDGYTFPMLGATKANYLQPGNRNGAGQSELSPLPCKNYANGACHHDYAALDMGLRKKMIDGHEFTPNDFPEISKKYPSPYLYYSVGVKILAITDGTITSYKPYGRATAGWSNRCASVQFQANDGTIFWIGHMSFDNKIKAGDKFKVGEVIGEIGPPPCAIGTQSHVHFQVGTMSKPGAPTKIYDIFNKLWESVPDK